MSFKDFDRKRFIVDTANSYAKRRISKRDFLKKMGMAGVVFLLLIWVCLEEPDRLVVRACLVMLPMLGGMMMLLPG